MSKRKINPFKVVESIGKGIGFGFLGLLVLGALAAAAKTCLDSGWGWWTFMLILIIPAILALTIGLGALWVFIENKWIDAKYRWENRRD